MSDGKGEVTAEVVDAIELYDLCRTFKQLPQPGGLFDQDCYYVWLLKTVKAVFNEKESIELEKQKQQSKQRPRTRR